MDVDCSRVNDDPVKIDDNSTAYTRMADLLLEILEVDGPEKNSEQDRTRAPAISRRTLHSRGSLTAFNMRHEVSDLGSFYFEDYSTNIISIN